MLLAAMYFRAGTWLKLEEAILRDKYVAAASRRCWSLQHQKISKIFIAKTFVFPDLDKNVQAQSFFSEDTQLFAASVYHRGCQNSSLVASLESLGE